MMTNKEFQEQISQKFNIPQTVIESLFDKGIQDPFVIAKVLIEAYKIDKAELGRLWGSYLGFAYVDPNASIVNQMYLEKAELSLIKEYRALPLYKFGRAVTVSTSDPQNPYLQDKFEKKLNEIVSLVFCFPFDIEKYIQDNYK